MARAPTRHTSPPPSGFTRWRRAGAALLLGLAIAPAWSLPLMEMQAEDLLPMAAEFRKTLNLTPNQQTLWQQTEARTRTLLRERQSRRERLQAASKAGIEVRGVELRELVGAVDAETATSAAEEKQMREWWLNVNDALNETQRQQVAQLVSEQLQRIADSGKHSGAEARGRDESGEHNRSGGRHKGNGAGLGQPGT